MGHYTKSMPFAIVLLTMRRARLESPANARAKANFELVPSSARIMV